jgi:predicted secreted protein
MQADLFLPCPAKVDNLRFAYCQLVLYFFLHYYFICGNKMFDDKRSKKIIFVAHCILNQNSKLDGCAHFSGAIDPVVQILVDAGIGIIQMPCPELLCLSLDRKADKNTGATIESEDTRIADLMNEENAIAFCSDLVSDIIDQIIDYENHGFEIIGVLGINGSPTCGVESGWKDNKETDKPGVFIQLLKTELEKLNLSIPFAGIKAYEPDKAIKVVKELISS